MSVNKKNEKLNFLVRKYYNISKAIGVNKNYLLAKYNGSSQSACSAILQLFLEKEHCT